MAPRRVVLATVVVLLQVTSGRGAAGYADVSERMSAPSDGQELAERARSAWTGEDLGVLLWTLHIMSETRGESKGSSDHVLNGKEGEADTGVRKPVGSMSSVDGRADNLVGTRQPPIQTSGAPIHAPRVLRRTEKSHVAKFQYPTGGAAALVAAFLLCWQMKRVAKHHGYQPRKQVEPESKATLEPQAPPKLERDDRAEILRSLSKLGVRQWSVAQVKQWVSAMGMPCAESINAAMDSLEIDGEELLHLRARTLQIKLAKLGVHDFEALAQLVIGRRDDALPVGPCMLPANATTTAVELRNNMFECPVCLESFCDGSASVHVPRILTGCGHTICQGCVAEMLRRVLAEGSVKRLKCHICTQITAVPNGRAANLPKNFAVASAVE